MPGMSTDPGAQDGVALRKAASDSDGTATASPSTMYEQMFQEAMARIAAISEEWQKARDALLGGDSRRPDARGAAVHEEKTVGVPPAEKTAGVPPARSRPRQTG